MCECDFYFFLYQTMFQRLKNKYYKNHLVNELIDSKKHENRLLTECRLISTNKKIDYWLSFSQIHDYFRWFTMRIMKMKCNHRFQRKNFFIFANSRSFSLIHVVDNFLLIRVFLRIIRRFSFEHSRISTNNSFVKTKRLIECQWISQNSKRKIACWKQWIVIVDW